MVVSNLKAELLIGLGELIKMEILPKNWPNYETQQNQQ